MEVWKIIFLSKWVIYMFHVNLPGCNPSDCLGEHRTLVACISEVSGGSWGWDSQFFSVAWFLWGGGKQNKVQEIYLSGQIIATSHDLTSNGGLVRENPLFQGNLGW